MFLSRLLGRFSFSFSFSTARTTFEARRSALVFAALIAGILTPCAFADLLVTSTVTNSVLAYDEITGAFQGAFVPSGSGTLGNPWGLTYGPDGNLYVGSQGNGAILRYDGVTGAFLSTFVPPSSGLMPTDVVFGPDGNLYVGNALGGGTPVHRYNGTTGAFMGPFVTAGSGGLSACNGLAFGPDGNLYVVGTGGSANSVRRYDGGTGAFMSAFVPSGSGGLTTPRALLFGPDGNLNVSSFATDNVIRYNGTTGAFLGIAATGSGLDGPEGLRFGPDGNLYVASFLPDNVPRYNGTTGTFLGIFASGGGLDNPARMVFQPGGGGPGAVDFGDAPDNLDGCEGSIVNDPPPSQYPTRVGTINAAVGRREPFHINLSEVVLGGSVTAEAAAFQATCDWIKAGCDADEGPILLCLDPVPGGCTSGVVITPGGSCVERALGVFGPYPGNPCYGMWIFNVTTSPTALPAGSSLVNVAVDWNLSGRFGDIGGEWPLVDAPVPIGPSGTTAMITAPFLNITCFPSGSSWAIQPFWTRFTIGEESIGLAFPGADWDGSGPPAGNRIGETEDWVPFGDPPTGPPPCTIEAGLNFYTTPPGGSTFSNFNVSPLPSGFFGPGSDPFTGIVPLVGSPLATNPPGIISPTNTIVRRTASATLNGAGASQTIPIEIVALSLVSVNPITVTYNGGQNPELWDVRVGLSSAVPQQAGTMTVQLGQCPPLGGTFSSSLPVQPRFTFSRRFDQEIRVVDNGAQGLPPIVYHTEDQPWLPCPGGLNGEGIPDVADIVQVLEPFAGSFSVDDDGEPSTPPVHVPDGTTNFFPGFGEYRCFGNSCQEPEHWHLRATPYHAPDLEAMSVLAVRPRPHAAPGFDAALGPGPDSDGDGLVDFVDNCPLVPNPFQQDQDHDAVGDVCDNCNAPNGYNPCQEDSDNDGIGDRCEITDTPQGSPVANRIALGPPNPNPVRRVLQYSIQLPRSGLARVRVFDSNGRLVGTPLETWLPAGSHAFDWDGVGRAGLRNGVYYLRLDWGGAHESRKFCVLR